MRRIKIMEKKIYMKPAIDIVQVEMEEGIAAGSNGSGQPGGGSGVQEDDWINGGSETKDPSSGEWWQ
ncbi:MULTISPECIES: hypothetical protein [Sphingobacterium]|uniref:hypothetical protein n=1 Tax=Sphingobacterium TaxID=28453 RepID=UPI002242FABA|nr:MULTISPECIES: hypothetical protein [Sphingobacterium]MCW8310459.1 hypothetical protein [Sphingobacterium sp. InxBP1]